MQIKLFKCVVFRCYTLNCLKNILLVFFHTQSHQQTSEFQLLFFLFRLDLLIDLTENIYYHSCKNYIRFSIATADWLWIQIFGKNRQKYPARIN